MLMHKGIPVEFRWLIEAKVRLAGEFSDLGKSSYAKKRRAKRLHACYKCARTTCNTRCRSLGMVSVNREDKIQFIKDGLSKDSSKDVEFEEVAKNLGKVLAEKRMHLVYGGGNLGLMGCVSKAALKSSFSLLSFLDYSVEKGFISPLARQILVTASIAHQLIEQLEAFVP
ncbi:hypothetical protein EZV62_024640 [Acer yangbiense]|uniref:Uncharacterized protein n=1 Tax=Acer yangbiense TaxID=1000413 RepID=A0A5C7GW95_9ROSI|nr:hypothetical protein EZV62_024640 [Acer yangbiense]